MRILKEDNEIAKEPIPVSFVTDMMSKGWDEVGYLKEAAAAIKETYVDTAKVEELMQDLMDAYLVFIGQLELYLDKEADIATSTEKPESEEADEDDKDDDKEDEDKADEEEIKDEDEAEDEITPVPQPALPEAEFEVEPMKTPVVRTPAPAPVIGDDFDFFVDFDEPDMTQTPVTDAELYDEEGAPKNRRLNG
jgi:hypothetical protein